MQISNNFVFCRHSQEGLVIVGKEIEVIKHSRSFIKGRQVGGDGEIN